MPAAIALLGLLLTASSIAQSTTWNGQTSSDWHDAGNWSAGVPTPSLGAVIPPGAPNQPDTSGVPAACDTLDLQAGAALVLSAGGPLAVDLAATIGGALTATAAAVDVDGTMTITGTGSADLGALVHHVAGFVCNGALTASGTLVFDEWGAFPIQSTAPLPNIDVDLGAAAGVLISTVTVAGDLTVLSGQAKADTGATVNVQGDLVAPGGKLSGPGTFDVDGDVSISGATRGETNADWTVAGGWSSHAGYDPTGGTVTMTGTGIAVQGTFHALVISAVADVTTSGVLHAKGAVTLDGTLTADAHPVDFDAVCTISNGGAAAFGGLTHQLAGLLCTGTLTGTGTLVFDTFGIFPVQSSSILPSVEMNATNTSGIEFITTTIGGDLTVSSGQVRVLTGGLLKVQGDLIAPGGKLSGPGTFDIDGSALLTGAIRGTTDADYIVGGSWSSDASFDPFGGSLTMLGAGAGLGVQGTAWTLDIAAGTTVSTTGALRAKSAVAIDGTLNADAHPLDFDGICTISAGGDVAFGALTHQLAGLVCTGNLTGSGTFVFDTFGVFPVESNVPLPAVEMNATNASGIELTGVTIAGDLTIALGQVRSVSGTVQVQGDCIGTGGKIAGPGSFAIGGDLTFTGTTRASPDCDFTCGGNWFSDANFVPLGGTVTLGGSAPQTLTGAELHMIEIHGDVSLVGTTHLASSVFVKAGAAFQLGGGTLDADGPVTVQAGATLDVGAATHSMTGLDCAGSLSGNGLLVFDEALNGVLNCASTLPDIRIVKDQQNAYLTAGTVTIGGGVELQYGTLEVPSGATVAVAGDLVGTDGRIQGPGTLDIEGNVTLTGVERQGAEAAFFCAGDWASDTHYHDFSGTVTLDGTTPTTLDCASLRHVTVAAGAMVSTTGAAGILGDLTIDGSLTTTAVALDVGGTVTISASGSGDFGALTHTMESFDCNGGALTASGTFVLDGPNNSFVTSTEDLPSITIAKPQQVLLAALAHLLFIDGDLTLLQGTCHVDAGELITIENDLVATDGRIGGGGAYKVVGSVSLTAAETASTASDFVVGGDWFSDAAYVDTTATISFVGSATGTLEGAELNAIDVQHSSRTVTITGATHVRDTVTVTGTLIGDTGALDCDGTVTVESSGTFDLGGQTHSASGLDNAGTVTGSGTLAFDGFNDSIQTSSALPAIEIAKNNGQGLTLPTVTVAGLTVSSGLASFSNETVTVTGDLVGQGGELHALNGTLDIDGNATWSGTALTTSVPAISCAGDWTADTSFDPASGTVTLDGTGVSLIAATTLGGSIRFEDLVVASGTRDIQGAVKIESASIQVSAGASIAVATTGQLDTTTPSFIVDGLLHVAAGGQLALGAATIVTITQAGTFELHGDYGNPARVVGLDGAAGFSVNVSGTISAQNYEFTNMGSSGVNLTGATIAPSPYHMIGGRFELTTWVGNSATMLGTNLFGSHDYRYIEFAGSNGYNISSPFMPTTVTNWSGTRAGPQFELDPNDNITWAAPELTQIANFDAVGETGQVLVTWDATAEFDMDHYLVERSTSPTGPFEVVGTVQDTGAGSSYLFVDDQVTGGQVYHYQLTKVLVHGLTEVLATDFATPTVPGFPPNVLHVGPGGAFTDIQAAVDAADATPNPIIAVEAGTYTPFTLDGSTPDGLRIIKIGAGAATIQVPIDGILVKNLPSSVAVELRGLKIVASGSTVECVFIDNCAGMVLLDECELVATGGGAALDIDDSQAVYVQECGVVGTIDVEGSDLSIVRSSFNILNADAASDVVACDVSGAGTVSAPVGSYSVLPGSMPHVDMPAFIADTNLLQILLLGKPGHTAIVLFGVEMGPTNVFTPFELDLLVSPSSAILQFHPFGPTGQTSIVLPLTFPPVFAGASFVAQFLSFNPVGATGRFSTVRQLTLLP